MARVVAQLPGSIPTPAGRLAVGHRNTEWLTPALMPVTVAPGQWLEVLRTATGRLELVVVLLTNRLVHSNPSRTPVGHRTRVPTACRDVRDVAPAKGPVALTTTGNPRLCCRAVLTAHCCCRPQQNALSVATAHVW